MIKRDHILRDFNESGSLSALMNVCAAMDEHTFLTKSGDFVSVLSIAGLDDECREAIEAAQITRRFASALRVLGEDCRLYQYVLKREAGPIPARRYDDPMIQTAISNRLAYLNEKAGRLYTFETFFCICYEGWKRKNSLRERLSEFAQAPIAKILETLSTRHQANNLGKELNQAREALKQTVASFVVQLPDELHARILEKNEAFRFFRRLVNYAPHTSENTQLKYDRYVDFQLCDSALECHRDHLRLGDYCVQALTLKEPPSATFAHLLRRLQDIPCEFIAATEWKRVSAFQMRKRIKSKRRHFHNAKASMANFLATNGNQSPGTVLVDDSAVAIVAELGACLEAIEVRGRTFGEFSMSVVLFSEDLALVKKAAAQCGKALAAHDGQLTEERYNLLNVWLAALPGNTAFNLRKLWLLDTNYADLSFLFSVDRGMPENRHLGTEYLAVLETNLRTPYFLNLHYQDTAHTLLTGRTGAGKSFLANFLLLHLQKYRTLTTIFDIGGSYENLTRLCGGAYLSVGSEKQPFTINPFVLPATEENLHFLFAFLKVLIESETFRMDAEDERDLYDQLQCLYVMEPEQRRLLTLSHTVKRNLRVQLARWVEGGPYASVFDNPTDNLTFSSFQTFDFEEMSKAAPVLEAFLFYVLHRATTVICDPKKVTTFKIFAIDEAWRFFRHPAIRAYIQEALKVWRKKNAAMMLISQSADDLVRSELLPVVVESCATKMFLANPDTDSQTYREAFHLNEKEAQIVANLIPKQQIFIKQPDGSKVVNLDVSPKDYWLYTSSPHDRKRRQDVFDQHGFEEGLEILVQGRPTSINHGA